MFGLFGGGVEGRVEKIHCEYGVIWRECQENPEVKRCGCFFDPRTPQSIAWSAWYQVK